MNKLHNITNITFNGDHMAIKIDGKKHQFNLKNVSSRLLRATAVQRKSYEISPSGYGIHWPLIDEDLSIDGLLTSTNTFAENIYHRN